MHELVKAAAGAVILPGLSVVPRSPVRSRPGALTALR